MPKDTFYHLPKEKQKRIREAAIEEIQRTSVMEMSINKIIGAAEISRGSFYQYFEGKEDLIRYLMTDKLKNLMESMEETVRDCGGNLFEAMELNLKRLIRIADEKGPHGELIKAVAEMGTDSCTYQFIMDFEQRVQEALMAQTDRSQLRLKNDESVKMLVKMLFVLFKEAAFVSLAGGEDTESAKQEYDKQLEMIRYGAEGGGLSV